MKKQKKNIFIENEEKKVFSQTYVLYDDAGAVKPTYVSELERYINIFSQFIIFSEKNIQIFYKKQ